MASTTAEELIKQGNPREALAALNQAIRSKPDDSRLRVFLAQLRAVLGDYEKALEQLQVAAQLDAKNLLMAQVVRQAIICEKLRQEVFAGERTPMIVGESGEWVGMLVQALQHSARGNTAAGGELRARALEAAPATGGTIEFDTADGNTKHEFEWLADADSRLGPMLEVIVDGRYYWAPFERIKEIKIEKPADLRDVVWMPVTLTWSTAASTVAFIPTRYAGTERAQDGSLLMARATEWTELEAGAYSGIGGRLLASDQGEYPILTVRKLTLNVAAPPATADGRPADMPIVKPDTSFGIGMGAKKPGG